MQRMNLGKTESEALEDILKANLNKHKELSATFDCHIVDKDLYYEHKLYEKSKMEVLNKVLRELEERYSYIALYETNPVIISHGTSEENLNKILEQKRIVAGDSFNYGIWFTEVGTGYFWYYPKYITLAYNKPTLKVIESTDDFLVPALGCVISCEDVIDLTSVEFKIQDNFDKRVNMNIALESLGLPKDIRELKYLYLRETCR